MSQFQLQRELRDRRGPASSDRKSGQAISMRGVSVTLGKREILRDFDLEVAEGEFVSILGPSGVGKSTILNVIAGFTKPAKGSISIFGRDVTSLPVNKRDVGFIFQEYALFPHMTVAENVRFPLDMRKVKRDVADEAVQQALNTVGLRDLGPRLPHQMSGGQRQRIAIARAIVYEPKVLLMDEPLSSLDRQLRDDMVIETRRLQQEVGITVVYVTHDQGEALGLSHRVCILGEGRIEQIGDPEEVYSRPQSSHAALLGGPMNLFALSEDASIQRRPDGYSSVAVADAPGDIVFVPLADRVECLGVRPHLVKVSPGREVLASENAVSGRIESIALTGSGYRYDIRTALGPIWRVFASRIAGGERVGDQVWLTWKQEDTIGIRK